MAPKPSLVDPELGPLTDDLITPEFRVFQRAKGHRFSSDDVATALVAFEASPAARWVCDLGTGLGSVLHLMAFRMPEARFAVIEAQDASYELLKRNVARNGLAERVRQLHGDLRDPLLRRQLGERFDLVTGTPPYFPPGTAVDADDAQRSYARIEYRGGVESYLDAGAELMAQDGTLVLCSDSRAEPRVLAHAPTLGLHLADQLSVIPVADAPPLFSVWTLRRTPTALVSRCWTLRDALKRPTVDADRMRVFSGFESRVANG